MSVINKGLAQTDAEITAFIQITTAVVAQERNQITNLGPPKARNKEFQAELEKVASIFKQGAAKFLDNADKQKSASEQILPLRKAVYNSADTVKIAETILKISALAKEFSDAVEENARKLLQINFLEKRITELMTFSNPTFLPADVWNHVEKLLGL